MSVGKKWMLKQIISIVEGESRGSGWNGSYSPGTGVSLGLKIDGYLYH